MPVQRRTVAPGVVGPELLSKSFREGRYGFETFSQQPFSWTVTDGFGDPTGTTGNQNAFFSGKNTWLWHVRGTQTILVPSLTTDGFYNFALDQTLADGWELLVGGNETVTTGGDIPTHYTMGTDDCFFRLLVNVEDASGLDLYVGLRKVEAFQATIDDYDELAAVRVLGDSSSAAADITLERILNNAATASTQTGDTLADATDLEILVQTSGRTVGFFLNGAAPSTDVTNFQFDSGEVVMPFVAFAQTTDLTGEFKLKRAEWGLLADKPISTLTVP